MNILIDIVHPAHVHLLRNFYHEMVGRGHKVVVTCKDIPSARQLLEMYNIPYIYLGEKKDNIWLKAVEQLWFNLRLLRIARKEGCTLAFGSSITLAHIAALSKWSLFRKRINAILLDDDDDEVEPLYAKYGHPFADVVLSPQDTPRVTKKVIYYPEKVFTGNAYPRNILLEQDGYVSVLLEYEQVTAIAVDGANRKWIGTGKAGVFLMSENGQEQLLHFTEEDNPLFSNQIESICINQQTGEVFFATAKGLVSYRGTATAGFETYEDNLVYPNPVPHGYAGMVAVNGLKANSLCKITDSSGRLVWQGYSHGGQLVWDGKDHYGNRPASGVYYVMVSDEDGKEKIVTKFVFIN